MRECEVLLATSLPATMGMVIRIVRQVPVFGIEDTTERDARVLYRALTTSLPCPTYDALYGLMESSDSFPGGRGPSAEAIMEEMGRYLGHRRACSFHGSRGGSCSCGLSALLGKMAEHICIYPPMGDDGGDDADV